MYNLVHHSRDFAVDASWTFSATGHGKGPCDGLGAVVKSTATQHLLRGGPGASFLDAKQFYEWCLEKNDRMVIARPRRTMTNSNLSMAMNEPNRPIEVRWLSRQSIESEYEVVLRPRWNRLSTKGIVFYRHHDHPTSRLSI
jgi:hypothetical protein